MTSGCVFDRDLLWREGRTDVGFHEDAGVFKMEAVRREHVHHRSYLIIRIFGLDDGNLYLVHNRISFAIEYSLPSTSACRIKRGLFQSLPFD